MPSSSKQERKCFPQAAWIEVPGTYAMFDAVESPLTQTFGLFEEATQANSELLEEFFKTRNGNKSDTRRQGR